MFIPRIHNVRCALVCIAAFLTLAVAPAYADDIDWPDTQPAQRARQYIALFNDGDTKTYEAWEHENRSSEALAATPMSQRVKQWNRIREMFDTLRVKEITESTPDSITLLLQDTSHGAWVSFQFMCTPDPPHKITGIAIRPATDPSLAEMDLSHWDDLEDLMNQVRRDTGIPAIAAAFFRDGKIVDQTAGGVREFGTDDKVTLKDRFHFGSVTKSVTGTMLGSLIERGVLSPDTTIGEALPDYDMLDVYRSITLEQLMGHVGGIPAYTNITPALFDRFPEGTGVVEMRKLFVQQVLMEDSIGTPGVTMNYSNAGVTIAGHIAEVMTGETWEDLVRTHVFKPIGMTTGGFGWPRLTVGTDQPSGHFGQGPEFRPFDYPRDPPMGPAGFAHSSITDFAKYAMAHLAGLNGKDGFLKAETIRRIHTPPANVQAPEDYAFGWGGTSWNGHEVQWHNGSAGTFFAEVRILPDLNAGVVIMMNAGELGDALVPKLVDTILAKYFPDS